MSNLIDNTAPRTPADRPEPTSVLHRSYDWASSVAAAEGQSKHVPDYEFSNRVFTRIDRLLNPR